MQNQPSLLDSTLPVTVRGTLERVVFHNEDNGWTVYTDDDGLSAQIEYMVLIKEDGVEVLTK